jgi:WD40 repeat protein
MKKIFITLLCLISSLPAFSQNVQTKLATKFDVSRTDNALFEFNSTETAFLILDYNRKITVWETNSRREKYSLMGKFIRANFSPNGKWLAVSSKKEITVIDAETGKVLANFNNYKDEILFLGWNPNSKNFAVGTKNFTIEILDIETSKLEISFVIRHKKKGFLDRVFEGRFFGRVLFTPDGNKVLTVGENDSIAELWNVETGKVIHRFTLKPASPYLGALPKLPVISYAEISPDGKWILIGSHDQNRLWKTETGKLVKEFSGYSYPRFSPDSRYLGMITDTSSKYRATAMFDLLKLEIKNFFPEYFGDFVKWSPDSKTFITDRTIDEVNKEMAYVWDTETGKQKAALKTYAKYCIDFVSTCRSDFDVFSFSPNGKILMSQNKKQVKFLNPENGETILILDGATTPALLSPAGNFVLAKDIEKGKIGLWEVTQ